jgi:nicotinamide phosphoribosyltransferase
MNLILNTDSYKPSHWLQYPLNTKNVFSYGEARGFTNPTGLKKDMPATIVAGLQPFVKKVLCKKVKVKHIKQAAKYLKSHGIPWNEEGWYRLIEKHDGKLPLKIRAVPEGTLVPLSNVLYTVEVTDPEFFWLTSYIETAMLRALWYATTVATISFYIKKDLIEFWKISSDAPKETLDFKLHDFGARGVSSEESSAIGGTAHLMNFMGTDNLVSLLHSAKYYNAENNGFSIPAAEHSTVTTWGKSGEANAYRHILGAFPPNKYPMVAVVSDSYDIDNAVLNIWGGELKSEIQQRGAEGGITIIRPDSGDPISTVVGVIKNLMSRFGFTYNSKGYKVLPDYIRVIQGDGIDRESINAIIHAMKINDLSIDNIAFGMGGALLQHMDRDTFQFAMKASAIQVGNDWIDVYKEPKTMSSKKSKKGRIDLVKRDGKFVTVSYEEAMYAHSELVTIFEDGEAKNTEDFDVIKNRVESFQLS